MQRIESNSFKTWMMDAEPSLCHDQREFTIAKDDAIIEAKVLPIDYPDRLLDLRNSKRSKENKLKLLFKQFESGIELQDALALNISERVRLTHELQLINSSMTEIELRQQKRMDDIFIASYLENKLLIGLNDKDGGLDSQRPQQRQLNFRDKWLPLDPIKKQLYLASANRSLGIYKKYIAQAKNENRTFMKTPGQLDGGLSKGHTPDVERVMKDGKKKVRRKVFGDRTTGDVECKPTVIPSKRPRASIGLPKRSGAKDAAAKRVDKATCDVASESTTAGTGNAEKPAPKLPSATKTKQPTSTLIQGALRNRKAQHSVARLKQSRRLENEERLSEAFNQHTWKMFNLPFKACAVSTEHMIPGFSADSQTVLSGEKQGSFIIEGGITEWATTPLNIATDKPGVYYFEVDLIAPIPAFMKHNAVLDITKYKDLNQTNGGASLQEGNSLPKDGFLEMALGKVHDPSMYVDEQRRFGQSIKPMMTNEYKCQDGYDFHWSDIGVKVGITTGRFLDTDYQHELHRNHEFRMDATNLELILPYWKRPFVRPLTSTELEVAMGSGASSVDVRIPSYSSNVRVKPSQMEQWYRKQPSTNRLAFSVTRARIIHSEFDSYNVILPPLEPSRLMTKQPTVAVKKRCVDGEFFNVGIHSDGWHRHYIAWAYVFAQALAKYNRRLNIAFVDGYKDQSHEHAVDGNGDIPLQRRLLVQRFYGVQYRTLMDEMNHRTGVGKMVEQANQLNNVVLSKSINPSRFLSPAKIQELSHLRHAIRNGKRIILNSVLYDCLDPTIRKQLLHDYCPPIACDTDKLPGMDPYGPEPDQLNEHFNVVCQADETTADPSNVASVLTMEALASWFGGRCLLLDKGESGPSENHPPYPIWPRQDVQSKEGSMSCYSKEVRNGQEHYEFSNNCGTLGSRKLTPKGPSAPSTKRRKGIHTKNKSAYRASSPAVRIGTKRNRPSVAVPNIGFASSKQQHKRPKRSGFEAGILSGDVINEEKSHYSPDKCKKRSNPPTSSSARVKTELLLLDSQPTCASTNDCRISEPSLLVRPQLNDGEDSSNLSNLPSTSEQSTTTTGCDSSTAAGGNLRRSMRTRTQVHSFGTPKAKAKVTPKAKSKAKAKPVIDHTKLREEDPNTRYRVGAHSFPAANSNTTRLWPIWMHREGHKDMRTLRPVDTSIRLEGDFRMKRALLRIVRQGYLRRAVPSICKWRKGEFYTRLLDNDHCEQPKVHSSYEEMLNRYGKPREYTIDDDTRAILYMCHMRQSNVNSLQHPRFCKDGEHVSQHRDPMKVATYGIDHEHLLMHYMRIKVNAVITKLSASPLNLHGLRNIESLFDLPTNSIPDTIANSHICVKKLENESKEYPQRSTGQMYITAVPAPTRIAEMNQFYMSVVLSKDRTSLIRPPWANMIEILKNVKQIRQIDQHQLLSDLQAVVSGRGRKVLASVQTIVETKTETDAGEANEMSSENFRKTFGTPGVDEAVPGPSVSPGYDAQNSINRPIKFEDDVVSQRVSHAVPKTESITKPPQPADNKLRLLSTNTKKPPSIIKIAIMKLKALRNRNTANWNASNETVQPTKEDARAEKERARLKMKKLEKERKDQRDELWRLRSEEDKLAVANVLPAGEFGPPPSHISRASSPDTGTSRNSSRSNVSAKSQQARKKKLQKEKLRYQNYVAPVDEYSIPTASAADSCFLKRKVLLGKQKGNKKIINKKLQDAVNKNFVKFAREMPRLPHQRTIPLLNCMHRGELLPGPEETKSTLHPMEQSQWSLDSTICPLNPWAQKLSYWKVAAAIPLPFVETSRPNSPTRAHKIKRHPVDMSRWELGKWLRDTTPKGDWVLDAIAEIGRQTYHATDVHRAEEQYVALRSAAATVAANFRQKLAKSRDKARRSVQHHIRGLRMLKHGSARRRKAMELDYRYIRDLLEWQDVASKRLEKSRATPSSKWRLTSKENLATEHEAHSLSRELDHLITAHPTDVVGVLVYIHQDESGKKCPHRSGLVFTLNGEPLLRDWSDVHDAADDHDRYRFPLDALGDQSDTMSESTVNGRHQMWPLSSQGMPLLEMGKEYTPFVSAVGGGRAKVNVSGPFHFPPPKDLELCIIDTEIYDTSKAVFGVKSEELNGNRGTYHSRGALNRYHPDEEPRKLLEGLLDAKKQTGKPLLRVPVGHRIQCASGMEAKPAFYEYRDLNTRHQTRCHDVYHIDGTPTVPTHAWRVYGGEEDHENDVS